MKQSDIFLSAKEISDDGGINGYESVGRATDNDYLNCEKRYGVRLPAALKEIYGVSNGGHLRYRYYYNGNEEYEFREFWSIASSTVKLPGVKSIVEYANEANDSEDMIRKCVHEFDCDLNKLLVFSSVYDDCIYVMDLNIKEAPVYMVIWTNDVGKILVSKSFANLIHSLTDTKRDDN